MTGRDNMTGHSSTKLILVPSEDSLLFLTCNGLCSSKSTGAIKWPSVDEQTPLKLEIFKKFVESPMQSGQCRFEPNTVPNNFRDSSEEPSITERFWRL
ncbi:hypothetical protein RRG08_002675 [Elysia crispata]|uniref:Uncharacterized protein n=1 Tax=Elysia crispata TaxID=231223 RepID=A0AAE1CMA6_9GAST|nr:hypothetical protein RRG08_002675 [Elysia crispata]